MTSPAFDSERILADARAVVQRQRLAPRGSAIGARSAQLRRRHVVHKLIRMALALGTVLVGTMVIGLVIGGIGQFGVLLALLVAAAVLVLFGTFPRLRAPDRAALNRGDAATLVGRTQLWLESARPALPPPAVTLLDRIGRQLDGLEAQLAGIDPGLPAVNEVRQLVGDHLPAMIDDYRRIPAALRRETRGGRNADQQLADGLERISSEIDSVTRELAAGDLDALAVRGRYLETRYGEGLESGPLALNVPELAKPQGTP